MSGLSLHVLPTGDTPDLIPWMAKISPCADQDAWATPGLKSQLNELQLNSSAVRGAERRAGPGDRIPEPSSVGKVLRQQT